MEKYLKEVVEQIRCKTARPYVEKELRDHIEDQIEYNVSKGMEHEEAVKAAVKEMGDPVETGISLDRIHKTKPAWGVIVLVAIITVAAMLLQLSIANAGRVSSVGKVYSYESAASYQAVVMYIFGFIMMLAFYFVDYTFVARFAKHIAVLLILTCVCCHFWGSEIMGFREWLNVFGFRISIASLMYLYVPVFAGILYKYRNTGMGGLIKSVVWMLIPYVYLIRFVPAYSEGFILIVSMLILMTIAISKGWFIVPKKAMIAVLWGTFVGRWTIPTAISFCMGTLPDYQKVRLSAWYSPVTESYVINYLREVFASSKLIGNNGMTPAEMLPEYNSDYIFAYISSMYGLLAGILVLSLLVFLIVSILGISLRQKNQLGMMTGVGVGTVLMINTVLNILIAVGRFPTITTFLPLFSTGRSNIIVTYALIGIVLSIYKYKSIYPKYVSSNLPKFSVDFKIKV